MKLQRSLRRTGLRPKYCKEISQEVARSIRPGANTKEIFKKTLRLVKGKSVIAATHYSLKKSLLDLGPAGFIFERFAARYFEAIGYQTFVGNRLQGQLVGHEVDIVAVAKNYQVFAECKFHNMAGKKNDIKIALYVKARWDDLREGPEGSSLKEFYLVSNTAFTQDAITYSNGHRLKLLGINAPEDESFLDKIKKHKLYPITSLKQLTRSHCHELIEKNLLLCSDLLSKKDLLMKMGMTEDEVKKIFDDINRLLG